MRSGRDNTSRRIAGSNKSDLELVLGKRSISVTLPYFSTAVSN